MFEPAMGFVVVLVAMLLKIMSLRIDTGIGKPIDD